MATLRKSRGLHADADETHTVTRILLIENRSLLAEVMATALSDAGHEVERVTSPEAASQRLNDLDPDVVVFGTTLPAGHRASHIRAWREQAPGLKVLDVSDQLPLVSEAQQADDGNPDARLRFPFLSEHLAEVIEQRLLLRGLA